MPIYQQRDMIFGCSCGLSNFHAVRPLPTMFDNSHVVQNSNMAAGNRAQFSAVHETRYVKVYAVLISWLLHGRLWEVKSIRSVSSRIGHVTRVMQIMEFVITVFFGYAVCVGKN